MSEKQNTPRKANEPKTAFGKWMVYHVIPNFANNVQGLVYYGAAILVIVVGLRGLGTTAGKIAIVPGFLLEYDAEMGGNAVSPNWVMIALFIEFFLLLLMATTIFFTPEEQIHPHASAGDGHQSSGIAKDPEMDKIADQVRAKIREVAQEEIKVMDAYLDKMHKQHNETIAKILQQQK